MCLQSSKFFCDRKKKLKKIWPPSKKIEEKKLQKNGIAATIRIGQEIQCLPYTGFSKDLTSLFSGDVLQQKKNWIIKLNHQNDSLV